jgi:tetratricopeptide (TPR) repeat protein
VAQARLLLKEAWIPERMGNYRQALRTITRARRTLAEAGMGEVAGQRAQLSAAYAAILQAGGRSTEAIRWCRAAMEDAQAGGDDDASAHAFSILSWALASTGQPEHILYAERALEIYERRGDLAGQALVLNYLGGYAYFEGRWDEAVELYERGRTARERTGDAVNAAYGVLNIGEILLDQGHVEEARQRFVTALRVWKAAGHRWGVAAAQSYLGQAAARSGQHDEAVSLLEDARAAFKDLGEASLLEVEVRIAEEHLLGGDVDAALTLATESIGRAERGEGINVHLPALHRIRGRALVAMGDAEAAREAMELSLESARRRNSPYDAARALQTLAELARVTGHGDANALNEEARAILERLGVIADLWPEPMGGRIL